VLSASLRRILTDNDAPERYAAFQNHI
jgi:hypothetical protein